MLHDVFDAVLVRNVHQRLEESTGPWGDIKGDSGPTMTSAVEWSRYRYVQNEKEESVEQDLNSIFC